MRSTASRLIFTAPAALAACILTSLVAIPGAAVPGDPIIPAAPSCAIELVSGDPATAPPAPTCYDPSGSDLDEFLVPYVTDANGKVVSYDNGVWSPYKWDAPNSTRGAGQVLVRSTYFSQTTGGYVSGHSWNLTFNTLVTATPAQNRYWVEVGACTREGGPRTVTAYFANEVGGDSRYIGRVFPSASAEKDGGGVAFDTQPALRVYDGATVAIPLVSQAYQGNGLYGGYTYVVTYWLEDTSSLPNSGAGTRRVGGTVTVDVPNCDRHTNGPGTGTGTSAEPKAKIVVLKRGAVFSKVKVILGSRKATAATKYTVVRDPRQGRAIKKTFVTKFKSVKYRNVRNGTLIKVRASKLIAKRRV